MNDKERIFELESRLATIWSLIAPDVESEILQVPCAIIRLAGFDYDSEIYDDEIDLIVDAAKEHIERGWQ